MRQDLAGLGQEWDNIEAGLSRIGAGLGQYIEAGLGRIGTILRQDLAGLGQE